MITGILWSSCHGGCVKKRANLAFSRYIDYDLCVQKNCACRSCLANLAVESRLLIFDFLKKHGQQTVSAIVAQTTLSQPTISYHLKQMLAAGLLEQKRAGRSIFYQVKATCPHHSRTCVLKKMDFYVEN